MTQNLFSLVGATWNKPYKPSGKCPLKAIPFMLVAGILGSGVAGVVGYYGGVVPVFLEKLTISISTWIGQYLGGCTGLVMIQYAIPVSFAVILAISYALFVGSFAGMMVAELGKVGKCRNVWVVGVIAFLCGITAYGAFVLMTTKVGGALHETSRMTQLIDLPGESPWMYFIVAIDAMVVIISSPYWAARRFYETPFCEKCKESYQDPIKVNYPFEIAPFLKRVLETSDSQYLIDFQPLSSDTKDQRISLELQKCPCDQGDYRLSAILHWQEAKRKKDGQVEVKDKEKTWFATMISPDLGRQLREKLFSTPDQSTQIAPPQVKESSVPTPAQEEQSSPIPSAMPSKVLQSAEIHCHKCSTINSTTATMCQQCGIDLLPGTSKGDRLSGLVIALIFAVACVVGSFVIFSKTSISLWWALCPGLFALIALLGGLSAMFAPTPPHERYHQRAERHLTLNPYQAIVDLTSAINHASSSDDEKKKYIEERTKVYGQIGLAEDVLTNTNERVGLSEK